MFLCREGTIRLCSLTLPIASSPTLNISPSSFSSSSLCTPENVHSSVSGISVAPGYSLLSGKLSLTPSISCGSLSHSSHTEMDTFTDTNTHKTLTQLDSTSIQGKAEKPTQKTEKKQNKERRHSEGGEDAHVRLILVDTNAYEAESESKDSIVCYAVYGDVKLYRIAVKESAGRLQSPLLNSFAYVHMYRRSNVHARSCSHLLKFLRRSVKESRNK